MLWPSLVVVASAATFLYLEARRSRLTFCGRRQSDALVDGEKSQLKPASCSSSSSQHATKVSKHHEQPVNNADRHQHGVKPAETSSKVSDLHAARHLGGAERLNGQVRSSVDVRVAGASPSTVDGPSSRRARRSHGRPTVASKSHSASSLAAVVERPAASGDGRAADDGSSGRWRLSGGGNDDKFLGALDSTPGRCASESHLHTAI